MESNTPGTTLNTKDIPEHWTATMQLRWVKSYIDRSSTNELDLEVKVLQQLFRSSKGNEQWREIPVEK